MWRPILAGAIATAAAATQAVSALACGALVAPDGDVRLAHVATLVAWHGGVEHYLTSFAYQGPVPDVGWIVPLPAVPDSITTGGRWTLQRLEREVTPPPPPGVEFAAAAPAAQVVEQTQVEALDVTVLRGSAASVIAWATGNGFRLASDVRDHLAGYGRATPYFMAAKYDLAAARARGLLQGDGVPLLLTMRVPHIWVPLEILAGDGASVDADVFLLTDSALTTGAEPRFGLDVSPVGRTLPGAPGFVVAFQEQIGDQLFHDLSSDRNMGWVQRSSWLTYLRLQAPGETVTYDLGGGADGTIRLASFGTPPDAVASDPPHGAFAAQRPIADGATAPAAGAGVIAVIVALAAVRRRVRRRAVAAA